ncbi:hypothetical protein VP1G_02140 [Cytospora mali]|uniref:2Fe-2S ferredoxin-type domain-containing protein n=1 Tax=Cytospora mali TaxID=578113 RepID=A0A194USR9_CYTMA|nr:hypothetical protein VP1G_02140 [Valsa mali var. pyri (nom. inval.)]
MTTPRAFTRALMRLRPSHAPASSTTRQFSSSTSSITIPRSTALSQIHRTAFRICRSSPSAAARTFSITSTRRHGHIDPPKPGEEIWVTFIDKDGDEHKIAASKGDNLLDVAQAHELEMEGACGGSCACSTCHVVVQDEEYFAKMPEPDDDENDMLDLAFGLTETSRLGCQVVLTPEMDGLVVKLPSMTRNLQASDFKS